MRRGAVCYVSAESTNSILERSRPLIAEDDAAFSVLDFRIDLFDAPEDAEALAALVEEISIENGEPVRLAVIDTLTLSIGEGDENSNADAVRVSVAAGRLA